MSANRFFPLLTLTAVALLLGLTGCATTNVGNGSAHDPWEGYNRAMFAFNEKLDQVVIKPVAQGYEWVMPTGVNIIITNFFDNIEEVAIAVNNLLQGKVKEAGSDLGRLALNSSLGIGGLVDVATDMGMEKHNEDFGQTFARWGMGDGPYFVLPIIGSSTVRDTFGRLADWPTDPVTWVDPDGLHYALVGLRQIDTRADLLPAEKVVEAGAIDKYNYVRDAYLQHRRYLIYDGQPPREKEEQ